MSPIPRIAAPAKGPAAMPRNVSAPMSPSARPRARPSNRWLAPDVASGTRAPPPRPCSTRAAISASSDCAAPLSAEPAANTMRLIMYGVTTPNRSASLPASGIIATYATRYALTIHDASRRRVQSARLTTMLGSAVAVIMSSRPATKTPPPSAARSARRGRRPMRAIMARGDGGGCRPIRIRSGRRGRRRPPRKRWPYAAARLNALAPTVTATTASTPMRLTPTRTSPWPNAALNRSRSQRPSGTAG